MTVAVTLRLEDDVKEQLDALLDELGMNMSSFFSIYAKQAIRERGIPFRITTTPPHVDALTNSAVSHALLQRVDASSWGTLLQPADILENLVPES